MPENNYPHLFSPLKVGALTLPNRVVMAPMSTNLGSPAGEVTPEQVAFYRARAEGGVGMIVVEFCCVQASTGRSEERQLILESDKQVEGHQRLVEAITSAGSIACLQLQHGGPGVKRSLVQGGIAVGPSDVVSRRDPSKLTARALNNDEIEELIECFGRAAELGVKAGYQAFELHGAHGYMLTAFMSPYINHREDQWGGDEDGRLNFPLRVIQRVKQAIGDRPLSYRLSADEFAPGGNTIDDMERIAPKLVRAGVDMIHASIGLGATSFDKIVEPMSTPEGWRLPYARRIKEAVDVPVISVGQIRWPATAERALSEGDCDLIALGRPLLADPAWANKARAGDKIRPCTSCNFCTTLNDSELGHIGCAENPLAGRELSPPLVAGDLAGTTAVVVGAGPGGMAAALMLQGAGFNTHLFESRHTMGGGLIASAAPPHKDKLNWYKDYLIDQIEHSAVEVNMNQRVSFDQIKALKPRFVVLANGSETLRDQGINGDGVLDAYSLLMGDKCPLPPPQDKPIVVYGGGETGCETAEYLAERGYDVVLVTRSPAAKLARSAEMIYRMVLLKRLHQNPKVTIIDNSHITGLGADGVVQLSTTTKDGETTRELAASRLMMAQGRTASNELGRQLLAAGVPCATIGDARRGGRIGDAVNDAYRVIQGLCATANNPEQLAC